MVDNPANIELIPWEHYSQSLYHKKVIEYIKNKVPKNSYLALELPSQWLNKYESLLEDEIEFSEISMRNIHGNALVAIDVLNECHKKNIKIIPIDSLIERKIFDNFVLKYNRQKSHNNPQEYSYDDRHELYLHARDEYMAKTIIQTLIHNPKIKQLYVLTGLHHTGPLQKLLQDSNSSRRLKVNINTNVFHKEFLERYIPLITKQKALILSIIEEKYNPKFKLNKNYHEKIKKYQELSSQIHSLHLTVKGNHNLHYNDKIYDSFKTKSDVNEERLKKDLQHHKNKEAERKRQKQQKKREFLKRMSSHKPI